jgi:uncharacterized membrane protein
MGTSTALDALLLVVVIAVAVAGVLAVWLARELAPVRPRLPADDCAPASASRLVPSGHQLEHEARRGVLALEAWLAARGGRT